MTLELIRPRVLLLANRHDLTCDRVVSGLRRLGAAYFRLNTEDLSTYRLDFDPAVPRLCGSSETLQFDITADRLDAVYFRLPTFLRESALSDRTAQQQLERAHRAAFMRNLMVFEKCQWVNDPTRTYFAEHKAVQLRIAAELGFEIPETSIANCLDPLARVRGQEGLIAVKGLDTVLVRDGDKESFGYTNLVPDEELESHETRSVPFVLQEPLVEKLDLRVTVVGTEVWSAAVTSQGKQIRGDWRLQKDKADFRAFELPPAVSERCVALVRRLGLFFGAIDLALCEGRYFFFEINPTGEWAWLEDDVNFPIADTLARLLARSYGGQECL